MILSCFFFERDTPSYLSVDIYLVNKNVTHLREKNELLIFIGVKEAMKLLCGFFHWACLSLLSVTQFTLHQYVSIFTGFVSSGCLPSVECDSLPHLQFSQHNLMMEGVCPGLYVDKHGTYWDVPLSIGVDFASIPSGSGLSYHLCLQHNSGQPKHFAGDQTREPPTSLLPGLFAKAAVSIKRNIDIWRKKDGKLKMVQPYDALLLHPHVSGSGIIGEP